MGRMSERYHPRAKHHSWCIRTLIKRDGGICAICKEQFESKSDITLDHKTPRSEGGSDEITNLQLAHEQCNLDKGLMTQEEWQEFQAEKAA